MINVAIIEDEKTASDLLCSYFERFTKEHGEEFRTVCFDNPIAFLANYSSNYELVMMDIELPDMNGMNAAHKMREIDKSVSLIFVTNMAQYAINGYEVGASDFIVKPVSYYDFALKLERALEKIKSRTEKRIMIPVEDAIKCVAAADIRYVEVIKHTVTYHTTDGDYETYGTLKKIESELLTAGGGFAKCNNCYLVNLRYVTSVKGHSVFLGSEELQISHPKKREFIKALNNYLGGG